MQSDVFPGKIRQTMVVDFSKDPIAIANEGLSFPEPFGRWSREAVVRFVIPGHVVAPRTLMRIDINMSAFVPPNTKEQKIDLFTNGVRAAGFTFVEKDLWVQEQIFFKPSETDATSGITLEFLIHHATRPSDIGKSDDERALGLAFKSLEVYQVESLGNRKVDILDFHLLKKLGASVKRPFD
ncbi:hypothetical protein [Burkholderia cenocepacia]|uniref:hypothetical protein n=1 Tax=Burkholderia cenocepacia TaxID=95486 RepID=UPI002AAFCEF9|nr:hypothetical protein [Burkholderia cenocepacia]